MAIDWTRGYSVAAWRLFSVNRQTWADDAEVGGLVSASVNADSTDELVQRATLSVDVDVGRTLAPGYYRLAMTAEQGGETERVDVATVLCEAVGDAIDRGVSTLDVTGLSILYPASVQTLAAGSYVPMGVDGPSYVADMLRATINAPVEVIGSFTVDRHVVFSEQTSVLTAVRTVLDAGGFALTIDGRGTVTIAPKATTVALVLDNASARLLHPSISRRLDYSGVPNVYKVTYNGESAQATNDDGDSLTSTVTRGWVSKVEDTDPILVGGETLQSYADRMLEEKSTVSNTRTYTREWWPNVMVGSLVHGTIASVGIDGIFRVDSQQLACGKGITVQEQSSREVRTWQRR